MKPGIDTIAEIRGGACNEELGAAISRVVEAVKTIGRKGRVTLHLDISPVQVKDRSIAIDQVMVVDEIAEKPPKATNKASLFFIDHKHNHLSRSDPDQLILDTVRDHCRAESESEE